MKHKPLMRRYAAVIAAMLSAFTGGAAVTTSAGTFETPVVTPNSFQIFAAGQQIGPWTVTRGDVHLIGAGFWEATDGVQSLDLDGGVNGGIARQFATTPLLPHRLSFRLAGNPASGPVVKTGDVYVNGHLHHRFSFDITGATYQDMNYDHVDVLFTATGFSTTIEFVSTVSPQGYGPVLDSVGVTLCVLIIC